MTTKLGEENELRKKVWKIINLTQANQLFVHSKNLEIKYVDEESKKVETKVLPEILSLCILNAIVPNSAIFLIFWSWRRIRSFSKLKLNVKSKIDISFKYNKSVIFIYSNVKDKKKR